MKKVIIPSLIARNQKEFRERFVKVRGVSNIFQLDIMDGKFVKNKSLIFPFKLDSKKKYETHLMISNPKNWIEKNYKKADTIIFHVEFLNKAKEVYDLIDLVKSKKRKVGIAINPKTSVKRISQFLGFVDLILVMTVQPGKYGAKFLPKMLEKVKQIRKLNKKVEIEVDGGMNEENVKKAAKAGANRFVVGSYLQKSENVHKAVKRLRRWI